MNLDEETKDKIGKLPIALRSAVNYLLNTVDTIINGGCDEKAVINTMATINNNAQGRFCSEDLMNSDKAGRELGFGNGNRAGLKKLLDKHGIKPVIITNQKCGYNKYEIYALRDELRKDIQNRNIRRKEKEARERLKRGRNK